ncbi:MAG: IS3 family transposase [Limnochordia bacterium]
MEKILAIHQDSRQIYGAPRIHAELQAMGVRKTMARLMLQARIEGVGGRKSQGTTKADSKNDSCPGSG